MEFYRFIIILVYFSTTQSSIDIRDTVKTLLDKASDTPSKTNALKYVRRNRDDAADAKRARGKAMILQKARALEHHLNHGKDIPQYKLGGSPKVDNERYHMDAVLNHLKRRRNDDSRRRKKESDTDSLTSSSLEMRDWKEEFHDYWLNKKFEAINSSYVGGDQVNMVAARPWGVPCGDPNQHDMPWGTCMMSAECDAEYRIYRGDYFCGRTQFVCCALQLSNYDMYQGFDVSFADTSFSTDSEEKKARERDSKENKKRRNERAKKKRQRERRRRKRQIKKNIRKIVREMRKILNRSFRNASRHRKKRTMLLKRYIKQLKKQYKKDRISVREIHRYDMEQVDENLLNRLKQISMVNKQFIHNATFRDIVVNGTMDKAGARMLAEAYPELTEYLVGKLRRDGGGEAVTDDSKSKKDYLEFDIEYGELYY